MAVQAAVGEEWLQGGGGEVSDEKLAFRRAMATRVEKMQFDTSLKPLAMQERIPNSQQQQVPQQQQQQLNLPQQQILFQWQQQPLPPAFYAGGAAMAAEPWRSRSVVANGTAGVDLNQQKGKDGLVAALGQQQEQQQLPGIVVDVSGMIVPPTTTTTTTMTRSSVPPAGLKKKIACTVLPKGMPMRPLPLHGYTDPFSVSQSPMMTSSSMVRLHHHQHYHGVTTTSSTTTASGAPHEQVQSFVQGNKRYKECMDYAHLGCRHFVPCNDPPDPVGGAAEQQMLKRQGVVNPVLMARSSSGVKASPPASAGNWKEIALARGIGVKLEPGRSFLGLDPQQRSKVVRVGGNNNLSCCRSKVELDDEQQQQQAKQSVFGGGASSSAVSQVTTAAAVSCVESAESDNNGAMVENLCNASSSPGDGDAAAAAVARSDQMNTDATKEEDEEPSPEVISAAEALDVLAHAAISWGDDGRAELGTRSRKAGMFVHGEIPFVQKRVKRCSRPSRVLSQLGTVPAAMKARSVPAPERASNRHPSRKRSVDDDFGPEAKKPRTNEQPKSSSKQKPKKKSTPKKKKPARKKKTTTTETKPEVYDEDEDGDGDDEEVVLVSSSSNKRTSSSTPKRKKLNAVVKRSEEEARQQQQQQYEDDDDEDDDEVEIDEHLAAAMEIQAADEVLGALVRSKRGRNQNLPVRFQGSVMGSWKKGNRKIKPKS